MERSVLRLPENRFRKVDECKCCTEDDYTYIGPITQYLTKNRAIHTVLVITTGTLSILRKKPFKGYVVTDSWGLLQFKSIELIHYRLIFYFDHGEVEFKSVDAKIICGIILGLLASYTYNISHAKLPQIIHHNRTSAKLQYPSLPQRRPQALLDRTIAFCDYFKIHFNPEDQVPINIYDSYPQDNFVVDYHFDNSPSYKALAHAISWESQISVVGFDSFNTSRLLEFLHILMTSSSSLQALEFSNYDSMPTTDIPPFKDPPFRKLLSKVTFKNCQSGFILSIMKILTDYGVNITSFTVQSSRFTPSALQNLSSQLGTNRTFWNMNTLIFDELFLNEFSVDEFVQPLHKLTRLQFLQLSKFPGDSSILFDSIAHSLPSLVTLVLSGNSFQGDSQLTKFPFSQMKSLNLSQSNFSESALRAILRSISLGDPQNKIVLLMNQITIDGSLANALHPSNFSYENFQPMITEFQFADNTLSYDDMANLFSYLNTQFSLRYIILNHSIVPNDQTPSLLKLLADFMMKNNIIGLEIASKPDQPLGHYISDFLNSISDISNIKSLNIDNAKFGEQGVHELEMFCLCHSSLNDLKADNIIGAEEFDSYGPSMLNILSLPSIQNIDNLEVDIAKVHNPTHSQIIIKRLKLKHTFPDMDQRISFYQRLIQIEAVSMSSPDELKTQGRSLKNVEGSNILADLDVTMGRFRDAFIGFESNQFPNEDPYLYAQSILKEIEDLE